MVHVGYLETIFFQLTISSSRWPSETYWPILAEKHSVMYNGTTITDEEVFDAYELLTDAAELNGDLLALQTKLKALQVKVKKYIFIDNL